MPLSRDQAQIIALLIRHDHPDWRIQIGRGNDRIDGETRTGFYVDAAPQGDTWLRFRSLEAYDKAYPPKNEQRSA